MYAVFSGTILRAVFQRHANAVDYVQVAEVQGARVLEVSASMHESDFHAVRVMLHEVESLAQMRYWNGKDATDHRIQRS